MYIPSRKDYPGLEGWLESFPIQLNSHEPNTSPVKAGINTARHHQLRLGSSFLEVAHPVAQAGRQRLRTLGTRMCPCMLAYSIFCWHLVRNGCKKETGRGGNSWLETAGKRDGKGKKLLVRNGCKKRREWEGNSWSEKAVKKTRKGEETLGQKRL